MGVVPPLYRDISSSMPNRKATIAQKLLYDAAMKCCMEKLAAAEIDELSAKFDDWIEMKPTIADIEKEVGSSLRQKGYLTRDEVEQIVTWKLDNSPGRQKTNIERVQSVPKKFVEHVTKAAFEVDDPKIQMKTLNAIPGIGYATATVFLAFFDPERYPVGDRYINDVFLGDDYQVTPNNYLELVDAINDAAPDGVPLRTVEKAYYKKYVDER